MRAARLHDSLDGWARRQPDVPFAEQAGRRLTYAEAATATRRLAGAMIRAGLRVGDRLAVLARNSIEYALLYFAASRAGAVVVPLNVRLAPPEWAEILEEARPRLVFASQPYLTPLERLRDHLAFVEQWLSLATERSAGWKTLAEWARGAPEAPDTREVAPDADLLQFSTSATTGRPKGVVLTHAAVTANVAQIGAVIQLRPGDRSLVVAPLFHAAAVPSAFAPVAGGACLVMQEAFEPAEVVRALSADRIAFAVLVPAMIRACLADVPDARERTYDSLRLIYYGASPIAESTLRSALQVFGCGFVQSYGLSEATQALTFLTPADHERALAERPDLLLSAGRAALMTEIRIVDASDRPLPPGQIGEIVARGPQLMRGYWNRPEESAQALRGGWLHTGDVGCLDDDGYLYVRDRLKDVIVSGGENVYASVVENVLAQHPAIAEAAVIGVPDARWGETVKAIVVLRPGTEADPEEIVAFCRQYLGGFEVPRSVEFVDALPRNASGKVLKRVLRERYWAGRQRLVSGA